MHRTLVNYISFLKVLIPIVAFIDIKYILT